MKNPEVETFRSSEGSIFSITEINFTCLFHESWLDPRGNTICIMDGIPRRKETGQLTFITEDTLGVRLMAISSGLRKFLSHGFASHLWCISKGRARHSHVPIWTVCIAPETTLLIAGTTGKVLTKKVTACGDLRTTIFNVVIEEVIAVPRGWLVKCNASRTFALGGMMMNGEYVI